MKEIVEACAKLIARFEGCRLKAYQDQVGVWTIGYGETLNIVEGVEWSQDEADDVLMMRTAFFLMKVLGKCPQLNQEPVNRIAACVSLAYNIGIAGFGVSSVCRYTKRREYKRAADSFLLWNKAGGKVNKWLVIRRKLERGIYLESG